MENRSSSKDTLLVFADDWGRHPSSCQHLVRRLRGEYRIVWANTIGTRRIRLNAFTWRRGWEKLKNWKKGIVTDHEDMWVIDVPMLPAVRSHWARAFNRRLVTSKLARIIRGLELNDPVILTTLPNIANLIQDLPRQGFIYYCTDDFSHWPGADRPSLQRAELNTMEEADIILAVSDALVEKFAPTGKCQYFPHGVDLGHFGSVSAAIPPDVLNHLPRPRIGFFGLIYEKLDFELLACVARRFSRGSLVLIGPEDYCPAWFRELPNVQFVGQTPYADLPPWISGLDVLLLPYVNDEMIRQSDPLKLRECLASGKPTVSIDIPEVRRYLPWIRVAATHEEFVTQVEHALTEVDEIHASARRKSVENDGWDSRTATLRSWINSLSTKPEPLAV